MFAIFGIVIIIIGILNIIFPAFNWHLREGWKVSGDSEPSDLYLGMKRLGGVFTIIIGLIILFFSMN